MAATLDELPVTLKGPLAATRRQVGILGWVLGREELPDCGGPDITRDRAGGFLRWVLSAEACDEGVSLPGRSRRGLLGWLFAAEEL